jgi:hypothetical protein
MKISLPLLKKIIQWLPYPQFRIFAYYYDLDPFLYRGSLFEPLLQSTSNVNLKSKALDEAFDKIDHLVSFELTDDIQRIVSPFFKKVNPEYLAILNKPKSNRGRKPKKDNKKKKRKKQGTGDQFSSQMTFDIKSKIPGKLYKIKLFRKGSIQIPGSRELENADIIEPLRILSSYLSNYLGKELDLTKYDSKSIGMINFGAPLTDNKYYIIDEYKLGELIYNAEEDRKIMGIREVTYINDEGHGTKLKLLRPTLKRLDRDTTVKISPTKAEFDGGCSLEDTLRTYWWLNDFIIRHFDEVVIYINPNKFLHNLSKKPTITKNANAGNDINWDDSDSSDTDDEAYDEVYKEKETTADWLNTVT